jgi:hypothetical protein
VCLAIFVEVLCDLFYNTVFITECINIDCRVIGEGYIAKYMDAVVGYEVT